MDMHNLKHMRKVVGITATMLTKCLRELAEHREIDRITIRQITDNCDYSPATFYRHFKDKYDLIAWDYAQNVKEIMDRIGHDGYTWNQTLLDGVLYFQKEKKYLSNLITHTSGRDFFLTHMTEINVAVIKKREQE